MTLFQSDAKKNFRDRKTGFLYFDGTVKTLFGSKIYHLSTNKQFLLEKHKHRKNRNLISQQSIILY